MIRYLTAGESHGPSLVSIIEGIPAGFKINIEEINKQLARRQRGYGRGGRMQIEKDIVEITSGLINGVTIGSPICLSIKNKDYQEQLPMVTCPRPGHADLNGYLKYEFDNITPVLERASARETAIRTAVGSIAAQFLNQFNILVRSEVTKIGGAYKSFESVISHAQSRGDTVGGLINVTVYNCPIGLGSYVHYDRKLDAKLAFHIMSVQGIKGVQFGDGFNFAEQSGSYSVDEIYYDDAQKYNRRTNHCGGIEGGMSNGQPISIRTVMKPIPTLRRDINSIDIISKESDNAAKIRGDVCAVEAASVVLENVVAWVILEAFLEKFTGDSFNDVKKSYETYVNRL